MGSSAAAYQDGGAKEFQIQKRADVLFNAYKAPLWDRRAGPDIE